MKKPVFLILFITVFFAACSIGGDLPAPVKASGKITGTVVLYGERDDTLPADGMIVSLDGTSFHAATDTNGRFAFDSIPFNTYNLTYTKAGYGTFKFFGFKHSGDTVISVVPAQSLGQLSTTTVTALSATVTADTVTITNTVSPAPTRTEHRGYRFFYGNDASVSDTSYTAYSNIYQSGTTPSSLQLLKTDFYALGFTSGSTVFVRAYGDSYFSNMYHVPSSGARIFPNINSTTVDAVSFVLP